MAEKIEIARLEFDTTALVKSVSDAEEAMVALKVEHIKLKGATEKDTDAMIKNVAAQKKVKTELNKNVKALSELVDTKGKLNNVTKETNKILNKEVKSIQDARDNNKKLNAIRNKVNLTTAKGREQLKLMNAKLNQNNAFIKKNVDAYAQQKIGIGQYEEGVISALSRVNILGVNLGGVTRKLYEKKAALEASAAAQRASTTATTLGSKALRIFKIALASTGIGLIVVALGSLVTYLATTQKGIDAVTKVTKPLQVIFQSLLGVIQNLGEDIADVFTNPKEAISNLWEFIKTNLVNRIVGLGEVFKALGGIISSGFTSGYKELADANLKVLTGVDDLIGKTQKATNATKEFFGTAIENGKILRQIGIDIENSEAKLVLIRTKLRDQIAEQELIAKNTALSGKERNDAAEEAVRLSRILAGEEKKLINLKIKEEEITQSLNDSGRADLKKLNELKAEAIQADTTQKKLELRFLGAKAAVTKEQQKLAKKEQDDQLKDQITFNKEKLKIDNEADLKAIESKTERDKLKIDQDTKAKKLEIDKLKVSHEEKEALKKQLDDKAFEEKKILETQRVLAFEESKKALQEEIDINNAVNDEAKALLKASQRAEKQLLELEQIDLEETEKAELKKLILQKYNQEVSDITEKAAVKQAKEKLAVTKKEIAYEKEVALAKISITQQLGRILTGLLGDSLGARLAAIAFDAIIEISKIKIATASAIAINTANGAALAIPTAGASVAAAKLVNGDLTKTSVINQAKVLKSAAVSGLGAAVKFEKGGLQEIGGKRHSQGGTKFVGEDGTRFEAEKGELIGVMNRTAASAFMAFNNSYGGGGGASVSNYLQQGGIVEQATSQTPQIDIESILQSLPTPIVDVKDIITEVSNRVNLVDGANY